MNKHELLSRIDFMITKGQTALKHQKKSDFGRYLPTGIFSGFRSAGLSFLSEILDTNHPYYVEWEKGVTDRRTVDGVEVGIEILQSLKHEVEQDWLVSFKYLVSAEIFSDFLEMAKYLLDEKYKDAAAVMIGSVLEEHIRQLSLHHSIPVFTIKGTESIPKKVDFLNSELANAGVYSKLEQKNITAWLDLRNKAAHGKYSEYVQAQVEIMYQGVADFIVRIRP